jgi:ABC-type nitrate/sulfonate/bicarbonate transport system permease component
VTSKSRDTWLRGLSLVGFLVIWQVIALMLDDPLVPGPDVVLASLWQHATDGDLFYNLGITLLRVAASFTVAMLIGTAIGIIMGRYPRLDAGLDGMLVLGLNIPALVTIILCYIWFGLTEAAAITAVALNKIPNTVVTVREGARAVDHKLLQVADAFDLPPMLKLRQVYMPQLYPYLMAAARSGLALIWKIVLVAELLGRSNGVGFQLSTFFQFFDITSILAYTLTFATVVLLVEALLLRPLDRRLTRWRSA